MSGLPADPDMEELFTSLFVEVDKEIMAMKYLESVRAWRRRASRAVQCK
jgi:hypothetical protein